MRKIDLSMVGGLLLILLGLLFGLQTFGLIESAMVWLWVVFFGAGSLGFLYVFVTNREQWWAIIPACTLGGLSVLIALGELFPRLGGAFGGALFLGAVGLSFWIIYLLKRDFWWAVIPGGALFTLALLPLLSEFMDGMVVGGVFFLGMGATFALVALLPTQEVKGDRRWAFIPAAVLGGMGLVIGLAGAPKLAGVMIPLALIVVGIYLVTRTALGKGVR
jgi:hypothetical protein